MKQLTIFLTLIIIVLLGYIIFFKNKSDSSSVTPTLVTVQTNNPKETLNSNGNKVFVFDNFHGSQDISLKFSFEYPSSWNNDGQYFSPEKIEYYDLYSVKAPFYFDLILSSIFDQTEFVNQITVSKRKSPDTKGSINYEEFKRYDLIDYGSYGGDSAGRVIVYVGPKITINGLEYYLVFHWEERPLTATISGNDPAIFEKIVKSIKFTK